MSFIEDPPFPQCPSFGYTSSPQYSVSIGESVSGAESRNRNWSRPRLRFDCTVGPRGEEDVQELLEMWHAVGGPECGFRFTDYTDYMSCRTGETPTSTDQPLEILEDSPATYQLSKSYAWGSRRQLRPIFKPVFGTILLSDNGVTKTPVTHYAIDHATGLITLNFTPVGPLKWGGYFDVPVRFDSEFPVELVDRKIQSVSFALKELRDPVDED